MLKAIVFACLLLALAVLPVRAQTLDAYQHLKTKKIATTDTIKIDSLSLLPNSVQVAGIDEKDYELHYAQSLLVWKKKPAQDSVLITYRRLSLSLATPYAHKSENLINPIEYIAFDKKEYSYRPDNSGLLQGEDITYTGSYARSLSLGNNQDVVLNSNFNFQVSGYLLDSIKVEAAITDNTIPFQPQGNTQRIQEFDQIYIRLSKNQHSLQVGDYNLERPKGYFINYFKRVQGLFYQTQFQQKGKWINQVGLSGSVAKGQFARNVFDGTEGNQGPYRLKSNNNELFFIVLAGTEKVYIDNVLLQRGENADYIIDYNTAEVLFMPKRMITKDSRIQVEFEYQDRNYLNSLIYGYNDLQVGKKLNVRLNVYANQDAKNQPYLQNLNSAQKKFLAGVGDSIAQAYYPGITPDTFAANKILYKLTDSLVAGILYDSVFVYTTNADSAQYSLSFSFVGQGKGNYVLKASNANGRVYEWRAPQNGLLQGNYQPVILLITPKKHHLLSALATYKIDSLKTFDLEVSGSNYDPNLFSKIDNQTHWSGALRAAYNEQRFLGKADAKNNRTFQWRNSATYEFVKQSYKAIAPFRNVEFSRDWTVAPANTDEHLASFQTSLAHKSGAALLYNLGVFQKPNFYQGQKHLATFGFTNKSTQLTLTYNNLVAADTLRNIRFFRPIAQLIYRYPKGSWPEVGVRYAIEDNRLTHQRSDTLMPATFWFSTAAAWLTSAPKAKMNWNIKYHTRHDKMPRHNSLMQQSHSHNVDAAYTANHWTNHSLQLVATYRNLIIDDTTFAFGKPQKSMVGRVDYSGTLLKRFLVLRTLYEIGNGQEQRRSFTYVEVPAGQGQFQWIDYNKDGVQQANEFETAIYTDQKRFIRIIVPTNEFVKVNFINFNQSLSIEPSMLFPSAPKTMLKKAVSLFSAQLNAQISNRILADEGMYVFVPFSRVKNEHNILATSTLLNQSIFFNRLSSKWGADYNYNLSQNKMLLTYGIENFNNQQHLLRTRFNAPALFTLHLLLMKGSKSFTSPLNDSRSFEVSIKGIEPSITWLRQSVLRVSVSYKYELKENLVSLGNQKATLRSGSLDVRWSQPNAGMLQAKGSLIHILYNGTIGESVAFNMLETLQPGQNFLWLLNWQRQLGKGLELSIDYEGRKMQTTKTIHTGRMTIRAIL